MPLKLPRITFANQPKLSAAFDAWRTWIEWSSNVTVADPLTIKRMPSGPVIGYAVPLGKKVQLTAIGATSGSYLAREVFAAAGGTWTVATPSWTGVVWEFNLNAAIVLTGNVYTEVDWFGETSDWRFQMGSCPS